MTIGIATTKDVIEIMNAMNQGKGNAHIIYAEITKQSTTFKYNDKILSDGHNPIISHVINFSCADRVALNDVSIPDYTKLPNAFYFCTVIIEEPTQIDPCWTKF